MNKLKKIIFYDKYGEGDKGLYRLHWTLNLTALALWGLGLGLVALYFASASNHYWRALLGSYFGSFSLLLLNLLPVIVLTFALYAVFNRVWAAVLGSSLIVLGLSWVSFYKLLLRNDPLLAADLFLAHEAANMTSNYSLDIKTSVVVCAFAAICGTLFAAFYFRARIKGVKTRLLVAGLCFAACLGCASLAGSDDVYDKTANFETTSWFLSPWSDRDQYISRGFVYPFMHSVKTAVERPPKGYTPAGAAESLSGYEDGAIPQDKRVNIIAVMLEAYNDFSAFGTLEFSEDPYDYFHKLQKESVSGRLVTNIFAGGTVDTERAFITGYPTLSDYRAAVPSYAWYMAGQGYNVEGGHPGYEWFYNRRNINRYLGFEQYYFYEDRYDMGIGAIMLDGAFFDDILTLYQKNKKTGNPYFNFSVTYQNHGPYADSQLYSEEEYVKNQGYSDKAYTILNNYFWGINLTDKAIENLIESLRFDDQPTIVVLFGDHNPWLGDGSYVYEEIGIDLSRQTEESYLDYFGTPYIIWGNDRAKEVTGNAFTGAGREISPCFLLNEVFDLCGYKGSAYMQLASDTCDAVSVINPTGIYVEKGQLTDTLSPQGREAVSRLLNAEYYQKKQR